MDLYFSPAAQVELDDAFAYLEDEQPGLGCRFTADVDEALGRIQMYPLANIPRLALFAFRQKSALTRRRLPYGCNGEGANAEH